MFLNLLFIFHVPYLFHSNYQKFIHIILLVFLIMLFIPNDSYQFILFSLLHFLILIAYFFHYFIFIHYYFILFITILLLIYHIPTLNFSNHLTFFNKYFIFQTNLYLFHPDIFFILQV